MGDRIAPFIHLVFVTKVPNEFEGFVEATVNIPDNVEGTRFGPLIVPQRFPPNRQLSHVLRRAENVDVAESFALQTFQRSVQLRLLISDQMVAEVTMGSARVPLPTQTLRHIEHQRDG